MVWQQSHDPFGNMTASTLVAALPVAVMLSTTGTGILLSAIVGALVMTYSPLDIGRVGCARCGW